MQKFIVKAKIKNIKTDLLSPKGLTLSKSKNHAEIPPIGTNFMHHLLLNTLVLNYAGTKKKKSRIFFSQKNSTLNADSVLTKSVENEFSLFVE
jgi:hypothetical protein